MMEGQSFQIQKRRLNKSNVMELCRRAKRTARQPTWLRAGVDLNVTAKISPPRLFQKLYSLLESIRVLMGAEGELRWTRVLAACPEGGDGEEGSGCLEEEGSGGLVLGGGGEEDGEEGSGRFSPLNSDDEDFVFVEEKEHAGRRRPTPLAQFGKREWRWVLFFVFFVFNILI